MNTAITALIGRVEARVRMFGVDVSDCGLLSFSVEKSMNKAADYCNISGFEYFPLDAEMYLIEYAAAEYILENAAFSPKWEKMYHDAEIALLRFRRVRW
jgi:hypothetical protein